MKVTYRVEWSGRSLLKSTPPRVLSFSSRQLKKLKRWVFNIQLSSTDKQNRVKRHGMLFWLKN